MSLYVVTAPVMAIIQSNTKYQTTMPLSVDTALLVWSCPCTGETHSPTIFTECLCVQSTPGQSQAHQTRGRGHL